MPRNSLRVEVDISIEAVTCPGVVLRERQDVYLSICMLGYQKRTLCLPPFFPLLFHQKFRFERTFLNCGDPAHLAHLLQFEDVLIELIQLSEDFTQDGTVLAFYQVSARDFLYPEDSLLPKYAESDREVLMHKKIWFSGISPKIEFSCKSAIQDSQTPTLDFYRDRVAERHNLEPDYVTVTPLRPKSRKKKKRTKSYEAPTLASTMRASAVNTSGVEDRPPFIMKRKDSHNRATSPSRVSSPSPRRPASAPPPRSSRTAISFRTGTDEITGNTSVYISEADCRICRIYQRYFGRRYWGHKKYYHPNNGITLTASGPTRNPQRDEELEMILNNRSSVVLEDSDEDLIDAMNGLSVTLPPVPSSDVEYARLPYSPRLSRSRSRSPRRSFTRSPQRPSRSRSRSLSPSRGGYASARTRSLSPVLMKPPLSARLGFSPRSPTRADIIHRRVQRTLDREFLSDDSDDSVTSDEALGALRSSLSGGSLRSLNSRYSSLF